MTNRPAYRHRLPWTAILGVALGLLCGCARDQDPPEVASDRSTPIDAAADVSNGEHLTAEAQQIELVHVRRQADRQAELLDPNRDGWQSEAFAEAAKKRLLALLGAVATSEPSTAYAAAGAVARSQRGEMEVVFQQPGLQVLRSGANPLSDATPQDLSVALPRLIEPLLLAGSPEFHVKVIRVELTPDEASTVVLYEAFASEDNRAIQQTARLTCRWTATDAARPMLLSIEIENLDMVRVEAPGGRWFADCTATVMSREPAYHRQFAFGLNHWTQRIERAHQMDDSVRNGLAIGDANGDGLDDVYVCQGPGLPNRLLIQNADGTVTGHRARSQRRLARSDGQRFAGGSRQ